MATSFAAYASQFINRQQQPGQPGPESSLSSSQPLFYSFTTNDGSHPGNALSQLDDFDDPHLRASGHPSSSRHTLRGRGEDDYDDDPYLRLDEEEQGLSRHQSPAIPLLGVSEPDASKGWLAHASPLRSPSPSSSVGSPSNMPSPPPTPPRRKPPVLPPPRLDLAPSMTESLLPRDGRTRPVDVFSLPDPRYVSRGRRKYNDSAWTATWLAGLCICLVSCLLVLIFTSKPRKSPITLPYTTLLHTVPLLTILIALSALVSYTHIYLLRIFVKPVMVVTSVFIPITLLISALWAFIGSFMWDGNQEPTWGETVGLRLFSIVPLVLAILTARRLVNLPREIHTASALLDLTTKILVLNPFLLALSPAVLLATLIASIPFVTLAFRLLLVGYSVKTPLPNSGFEWHVRAWANWAIVGTIGVWLWSWGVARGLLKVTCAGVIGAWYFADSSLPPPPPTSTHTIHAALTRASQPSLGSIVLSALIHAAIRLLGFAVVGLRALPYYLPPYMRFVSVGAGMAVRYLETVTGTLSTYALIYTGLTGDPFMHSARRSRALTSAVQESSLARYRNKFKTEPPLTMLTVAPLTLTFPFALTTYLFVAHTLNAPDQALAASLLAGAITALVGLFCVGLVKDTADTLYICYCIDKDVGEKHRQEVFDAFEYESPRRQAQQPQTTATQTPRTPSHQPAPLSATMSKSKQPLPPQPSTSNIRTPSYQRPPLEPQPRRTQQLISPPLAPLPQEVEPEREDTPDPFLQDHPEPEPYSTSPGSSHSMSESLRMTLNRSHPTGKEPVLPGSESEDEGVDDSQLFPGSDLF
ncbi:plasma-membrane choline transporter-domain-containing protein [Cristinia sonorae]|uniref:Plasma-membrane choline transporter-domain-containing protein n=1 Tax=Cristinia sonorae TaxID=1940300 RepID=A0A8K0XUH0_9AGAR|nr:plasma-membrane choline transporter-domain-containing protein [Cristinia sonorae]